MRSCSFHYSIDCFESYLVFTVVFARAVGGGAAFSCGAKASPVGYIRHQKSVRFVGFCRQMSHSGSSLRAITELLFQVLDNGTKSLDGIGLPLVKLICSSFEPYPSSICLGHSMVPGGA